MSDISRRHILGAAAAGGALASISTDGAAQAQPSSAPAPKLLAGSELPSFRFALGARPRKSYDGGWAKEATAAEFPVSDSIAGVLMQLEPGALRELHWHSNAAEWAYVIRGRCRVTTIDPQGRSQAVDFGPGDVWYFPRGFGHSLQGIGSEDCLFVLVFDNGHFSEFATFSITDWVAHTPPEVLQKTFGVPAQRFANFPRKEVYMAKGQAPAPLPLDPAPGTLNTGPLTHRYRLLAQKPEIYSGGTQRLVSQREFPLSATMTGAILRIKPGAVRELHWHPNADEWQYYIAGRGRMGVFGSKGRFRIDEFAAGDVGFVPQGYGHYIENTGPEELEVLVVLNSGDYQSISLTAWMAANPPALLATNFGVPPSTFDGFPTAGRIIAG